MVPRDVRNDWFDSYLASVLLMTPQKPCSIFSSRGCVCLWVGDMKQFVNFWSNQHQIKRASWTVSVLHNPPWASDKVWQLIRSVETHGAECEQVISKLILQEQLESGTNTVFCVTSVSSAWESNHQLSAVQTLRRLTLCLHQRRVALAAEFTRTLQI